MRLQNYNIEIIIDSRKSVFKTHYVDYNIVIHVESNTTYGESVLLIECNDSRWQLPDSIKIKESKYYIMGIDTLTPIDSIMNIDDLNYGEVIIKITNNLN